MVFEGPDAGPASITEEVLYVSSVPCIVGRRCSHVTPRSQDNDGSSGL